MLIPFLVFIHESFRTLPRRFPRFTSRVLTSLIMPVGIMEKSGPEYWPIIARVIYLQALAICKYWKMKRLILVIFPTVTLNILQEHAKIIISERGHP